MTTFDGETFLPLFDQKRLSSQYGRVFECMKDGQWRTYSEISTITGDPEASISARLRDMRKAKFGAHTVNDRRRGNPMRGLWEYQLLVRSNT